MKILRYVLTILSIFMISNCSADSVDQSFSGTAGGIQQTMGENSDINNDNTRNTNINSSNNENQNSVIINIQTHTDDIVKRLPESRRKVAKEVSGIAIDLVKASSTENNDEIKNSITKKLADLSLLDYQASSSPFTPPTNKAQLICNNTFKFAYRGMHDKKNDNIAYVVNNIRIVRFHPGDSKTFNSGNIQLELLYLEYDKEKDAPILHYECID